jgi:hypothetical protein
MSGGFSATGQSGDFHYLVEFLLDSTTLNYADEDLSLRDGAVTGAFYSGRLPPEGTLTRTLGTFIEPRESVDAFDVPLDNSDNSLAELINNSTFANREVRIWLGEGNNKANYSRVFTGFVAHPNGISWDERQARFTVIDKRIKDRKVLPLAASKFTTDVFPNIEKKNKATPIPIVYGNWSSLAASGVSIPCVCTDQRATGSSFQFASHGIKSVDRFLKNASVLTGRSGAANSVKPVSLATATFDISGYAYNATSDTVSVNCQGLQSANSTLYELPGDILRNLLTSYLGLTTSDINGSSFNELSTKTSGVSCRRFIKTETASDTVITELLNETQIDLRFVNGQYDPKFRKLDSSSTRTDYQESDIVLIDEDNEQADFNVTYDPDRFYTNQIPANYQYDPIDAKFLNATTLNNTSAILRDEATVERVMNFYWLFDKTIVENRIRRELVVFSTEPPSIDLTLTRRAMLKNLGDQVDITYNIFDNNSFQIRRMETNLGTMTTRIQAYDIFTDSWGGWAADGSPAWAAASINQRQDQGFWCDALGRADPADANSDLSKWYG